MRAAIPERRKAALVKKTLVFVLKAVLGGLLVLAPVYVAVLLVLKGMKSLAGLVQPFTHLLPGWVPAEEALSPPSSSRSASWSAPPWARGRDRACASGSRGPSSRESPATRSSAASRSRSPARAGRRPKPALFQSDEALLPAFIIEELDDGRYTVFVPSIPTPFAGAVYILDRQRVHPVDVPFTDAVKVVTRWGSGAKGLVAAMEKGRER